MDNVNYVTLTCDKDIVYKLLSNDKQFEYFFFNKQCVPMLSKIRWVVFDNKIELEEMSNELNILLKSNDWHKLRTFGFKSTLFGWLKIVALNHFSSKRDQILPEEIQCVNNDNEILDIDSNSTVDIVYVIEKMSIPKYKEFLWLKHVEKREEDEIKELLSLPNELFLKVKYKAYKHLIKVIRNEGEFYSQLFLKISENTHVHLEPVNDPTEKIITKIDVRKLLSLIANDRYRFVIDSLILKDMERGDVADILSISIENLDNIKSRALKQLAEIIKKEIRYGRL